MVSIHEDANRSKSGAVGWDLRICTAHNVFSKYWHPSVYRNLKWCNFHDIYQRRCQVFKWHFTMLQYYTHCWPSAGSIGVPWWAWQEYSIVSVPVTSLPVNIRFRDKECRNRGTFVRKNAEAGVTSAHHGKWSRKHMHPIRSYGKSILWSMVSLFITIA